MISLTTVPVNAKLFDVKALFAVELCRKVARVDIFLMIPAKSQFCFERQSHEPLGNFQKRS